MRKGLQKAAGARTDVRSCKVSTASKWRLLSQIVKVAWKFHGERVSDLLSYQKIYLIDYRRFCSSIKKGEIVTELRIVYGDIFDTEFCGCVEK